MVVVVLIVFILAVSAFSTYIIVDLICGRDGDKERIAHDLLHYFKKTNEGDYVFLTFKQFLAFYNVAPDSWGKYDYNNSIWFKYENDEGETFLVSFTTYGEQFKFRCWARKKRKHDKTLADMRRMNKFIDSVRADSKRAEEEAMREASKLHDRIAKELEKGENNVSMGR